MTTSPGRRRPDRDARDGAADGGPGVRASGAVELFIVRSSMVG